MSEYDAPLADLVVLDLTRALAGPQAAMMLGDLGPEDPHDSTYFMSANRNKESIVLDLKADDDREVLARLVARSDVLLENFRTGVLDRLGFPVARLHELNPGLVIGSISGFGHDGPEAGRAGYDQIAQGEAGLVLVGGAPGGAPRGGVPVGGLVGGG